MVKKLKVEFNLPLKYNDGIDIEPQKFFDVKEELIKKFGGFSTHPLSINGGWFNREDNCTYYDSCKRFEVCVEKTDATIKELQEYKEKLKKDFKQIEVFMLISEVEQL